MNQTALAPHRGALVLVLGILSWCGLSIFTGLPAWLLGRGDLREMDAGRMDPEGRTLTQVGTILGMIQTILAILGILFLVVFLVLGLGFAASGAAAS